MRRTLLLLTLLPALGAWGCANSVVDGWVARAERGIDAAEHNVRADNEDIRGKIALARETGIGKLSAGLRASHAAGELDERVFAVYDKRLGEWLGTTDQWRADTDIAEDRAVGNLDEIRKCMTGITRASRAVGSQDDVDRRFDQIESLVRRVLETSYDN